LDIRMESLREIRQALANPLPPPEPLLPITFRAAHRTRNALASATAASPSHHRKLIAEARNVLAKIEPTTPMPQFNAYAEIDRHAPQ
jgi:hypothetical protein